METFKHLFKRADVQVGCCIWLAAGFVAIGIQCELNKSEWASWVQAVGSIMALVVAIFVMSRQNRNAYKLLIQTEERQRRRNSDIVVQIIRASHYKITKGCALVMEANGQRSVLTGKIQALKDNAAFQRDLLNSIPILELGSVEFVAATQKMKNALITTIEVINMMDPILTRSPDSPVINELLNRLISSADRALEVLETHISNRDS